MPENKTSQRASIVKEALKDGQPSVILKIVGRYTIKDAKGKSVKHTTNDEGAPVKSYDATVALLPGQPEQVQLDYTAGLVIRLQNALRDKLREANGHAEPKKATVLTNAAFKMSSLVHDEVEDAAETWEGFQKGEISLDELVEFIEAVTPEPEEEPEAEEDADDETADTAA